MYAECTWHSRGYLSHSEERCQLDVTLVASNTLIQSCQSCVTAGAMWIISQKELSNPWYLHCLRLVLQWQRAGCLFLVVTSFTFKPWWFPAPCLSVCMLTGPQWQPATAFQTSNRPDTTRLTFASPASVTSEQDFPVAHRLCHALLERKLILLTDNLAGLTSGFLVPCQRLAHGLPAAGRAPRPGTCPP